MTPLSRSSPRPTAALVLALALGAAAGLPAVAHAGADAARSTPDDDAIVVRFKSTASAETTRAALKAAGATRVDDGPDGAIVVEPAAGEDRAQVLKVLRSRPSVVWAGRTYTARTADFTPNDTGLAARSAAAGGWNDAQWDLTGPFGIRAPEAWDLATAAGKPGGEGISVAVLDTGVAYADSGRFRRSPDLPRDRMLSGYDFVAGDTKPYDANGHGTFVASTIGAAADNGYGMVGVAYRAKILPVRVLDQFGEGSSYRVAQGIRYAARKGARIINVSIELADDRGPISLTAAPDIRSALRYARTKGSIVVAAAGNSAIADVPATRFSSLVIQVGGSTEHGCVADYSNYGPGLDVVAPGGGADAPISGDPECAPQSAPGRTIAQVTFRRSNPARFLVPDDYEGTSMAAPHVTGAVALLLGTQLIGARPTTVQVKARLAKTARVLGNAEDVSYYGAGLLDAAKLLGATTDAPATSTPTPTVPATTPDPTPAPTPTATTGGGTTAPEPPGT